MAGLIVVTILCSIVILEAQKKQVVVNGVPVKETIVNAPGSSESGTEARKELFGVPCVWPDCEPRCLPCKVSSRSVGSCLISSCDESRGPTDCSGAKCLCKELYCATEEGRCEPQICLPGAKPPKFKPNNWVHFYSSMADDIEFPSWDEMKSDPMGLASQVLTVPVLMLLLGMLAGITVFFCLCCRRSELQRGSDGGESDSSGGRMLKMWSNPSLKSKKAFLAPSMWPMLLLALAIIVLSVCGIVIRTHCFQETSHVIEAATSRALNDTETVADACRTVNSTVNTLRAKLGVVLPDCSQASKAAKPIVDGLNQMLMTKIDTYVEMGNGIIGTVQTIPGYVKDVQDFMEHWKPAFVYGPMVPMLLMSLVCLLIVIPTLMVRCCDNRRCANFSAGNMKWSAGIFCLVILVVAVVCTVEVVAMIVVSKFCLRPSHNTRGLVNATTYNISAIIPELTDAYIAGKGENPIKTYEVMVADIINKVDNIYGNAQTALLLLGNPCPQLLELGIFNITNKARGIIGEAKTILETRNIYPYYDDVLEKGICGAVVNSISWMWLLQILVGFVLFPLCAVYTFSYLEDFAAWMDAEERGHLVEDSEDDD